MQRLSQKLSVVALLVLAMQWSARAQTIADQINTILAGSAVSNNTWTILIENDAGTVNVLSEEPNHHKSAGVELQNLHDLGARSVCSAPITGLNRAFIATAHSPTAR